ncbi:FeoA family protein [uncultured Allomuricauda sp.]|uniref:FeoA family protein n=1 Tax=Flagellimonas sp. W118 TaxID=3410791 RepID=UPI00262770EF|nr:FeoA family protein [uncultured Allomuricauda sp.]
MVTVAELGYGQKGVIKEFSEDILPIKLLELGCLPGNSVELVQVAPLNDPIYINVNGSHIAIRRSLAKQIEIEIQEDPKAI